MASLKVKEAFCLIYSGLLFISGVLLITFSAILLYRLLYHYTFVPSGTIGPFIVIFLLGIVHLFLTWLGIKGPTREHNFHIVLFMIFTLTLLVSELAIGIWSMVLWSEIEIECMDLMTESFEKLLKSNYEDDKKAWNKVQSEFECCGLAGSKQYVEILYPSSCYKNQDRNSTLYEDGCRRPIIGHVKSTLIDAAVIGFLCAVFQGLGVFLFCTFFKTLRAERAERIARRSAAHRELASADQHGDTHNNTSHSQAVNTPESSAKPPPSSSPPPTTPPTTTAA